MDHLPEIVEAIAPTDGLRLDLFLQSLAPWLDKQAAGTLVREGAVEVVGKPLIKPSLWLSAGQVVRVRLPEPAAPEAQPRDLPLPILYADDALVVVRKPAGMATHPGPGWWQASAVNALLHHLPRWRPVGGVATPGIVHRLDRDTEGLLAFANGDEALQRLLAAMRDRRITRRYLALVEGHLEGAGTVDAPLTRNPDDPQRMMVRPDGKPARTHWRAVAHEAGGTWLSLELESGRNHQIRVHMASLGHPVAGDPWYGNGGPALRLYATHLALDHPTLGVPMRFVAWPAIINQRLNFE